MYSWLKSCITSIHIYCNPRFRVDCLLCRSAVTAVKKGCTCMWWILHVILEFIDYEYNYISKGPPCFHKTTLLLEVEEQSEAWISKVLTAFRSLVNSFYLDFYTVLWIKVLVTGCQRALQATQLLLLQGIWERSPLTLLGGARPPPRPSHNPCTTRWCLWRRRH